MIFSSFCVSLSPGGSFGSITSELESMFLPLQEQKL